MYTRCPWQGSATGDSYIALASIDMSTSVNINTRMSMNTNKPVGGVCVYILIDITCNQINTIIKINTIIRA